MNETEETRFGKYVIYKKNCGDCRRCDQCECNECIFKYFCFRVDVDGKEVNIEDIKDDSDIEKIRIDIYNLPLIPIIPVRMLRVLIDSECENRQRVIELKDGCKKCVPYMLLQKRGIFNLPYFRVDSDVFSHLCPDFRECAVHEYGACSYKPIFSFFCIFDTRYKKGKYFKKIKGSSSRKFVDVYEVSKSLSLEDFHQTLKKFSILLRRETYYRYKIRKNIYFRHLTINSIPYKKRKIKKYSSNKYQYVKTKYKHFNRIKTLIKEIDSYLECFENKVHYIPQREEKKQIVEKKLDTFSMSDTPNLLSLIMSFL